MKPLEIIGQIDIPCEVLAHRFVREALGCARHIADEGDVRHQVVGTANTRKVELYGWAPHVDSHVDNTGWVYLLALNEGRSTLNVWGADGEPVSVWMPAGAVVRLDDRAEHWTEDDSVRICAFIGSYPTPHDYDALVALQAGVSALARGDYYGAPRVRDGFRVLMPDECIVGDYNRCTYEPMLLIDAQRQRRWVETCALCCKAAVKIDQHWPYHTDMNRCAEHLKGDA